MQYEYILMVIPIIIIVAFLVVIAKRMTDGERPDISGAVLGTIIIAVGLLIMVPIIESADPYDYNSETKTFTVSGNITGTNFSWGSAANAENLIIEEGVRSISAGAFASFEDLKYISIPVSIEELGENVFGVTLKDYLDQTITDPEAGDYVGSGDGTLYYLDESIYVYSTDGAAITGLTDSGSSAVNLVLPTSHNGTTVTILTNSAFQSKTTIARVLHLPDSGLTTINSNMFNGCSGLQYVDLPETLTSMGSNVFLGCTSLTSIDVPSGVTSLGSGVFNGCTALESVGLPSALQTIGTRTFIGCSHIEGFDIPGSVTSIGNEAFSGCIGVTSVSFGSGFAATLGTSCFNSWTFYESDGTTQLDKTVASNLAGYTFQGTASALVKVLPDRSALTPEQTLKVQELTKAAKALTLEYPELAEA